MNDYVVDGLMLLPVIVWIGYALLWSLMWCTKVYVFLCLVYVIVCYLCSLREELKSNTKAYQAKMEMSLSKLESEWQAKLDMAKKAHAVALAEAIEARNKALQGIVCMTSVIVCQLLLMVYVHR